MADYPYSAVATLKYKSPPGSPEGTAIHFSKGDPLTVLGPADDDGDWLEGTTTDGIKGVFPAGFVQRVEQEHQPEPIKQDEPEAAPLAQAIAAGVSENDAQFQRTEGDEVQSATEDKPAEPVAAPALPSPAQVQEEAPPPPPPAVPSSPPALSSGHETITDSPRPVASTPDVSSSSPAASPSGPPPPAKKPSGLASRLAFFQQAAEESAGPKPPARPPKPAGGGWKRPAAPPSTASPPPPAPAPVSSPPPAIASPPPMVRSASNTSDQEQQGAGFSAADAQESVARGGGSLKDRIAALQGGKLKMEQPALPGRAPKPWKAKPVVAAEEEEEEKPAEEAEEKQGEEGDAPAEEGESQVKDEPPAVDETNEQSPGAEVPGFEPAEATPAPASPVVPAQEDEEEDKADVTAAAAVEQEPIVKGEEEPVAAEDKQAEEEKPTTSVPAISTGRETITDSPAPPSLAPESASLPPHSPSADAEETPEEAEAAQRSAIAARMAGLGGQRMGLPIPALPKRAAGPRRNRSAQPKPEMSVEQKGVGEAEKRPEEVQSAEGAVEKSGAEQVEEEVVAPPQLEQETEEQPVEEGEKKDDILASMGGGAAALLSGGDDDEEERKARGGDDEDDFDTPAPPPPSAPPRRAVPPPAPVNEPEQPAGDEFEDPPVEPGETIVGADELVQRIEPESKERTIAEEAAASLPDAPAREEDEELVRDPETSQAIAPVDAEAPPKLPPGRPPIPPPFVREDSSVPAGAADETEGAAAVTEEQQEELEEKEEEERRTSPLPPPRPMGVHPVPPARIPSRAPSPPPTTAEEKAERDQAVRPPIPTHPPGDNKPSVITAAEREFILSQPEILSPPEEAADESTTAVDIDAPSVATIAAGHEDREVSLPQADQPHHKDSREEGVATPAFEAPQQRGFFDAAPSSSAAAASKSTALPAGQLKEKLREEVKQARAEEAVASVQGREEQQEEEHEGEEEEDDEEEEEEDPEVARRRALAARMAKLGGVGMGPMFGGLGGMAPPKPPKKKKSVKREEEPQELEENAVSSQPASRDPDPVQAHPPRRIGGIPQGGFALPGIVAPRREPEPEPEPEPEVEEHHVQPAADEDVAPEERGVPVQQDEEDEPAPPPLPAGRPPTGPPRRSVPVPAPEAEEEQGYEDPAADEEVEEAQHASHLVDEPESVEHYEPEQEESDMPPPPPPPRPAGGHQASKPSLPSSPTLPSSGPPSRAAPSPLPGSPDLARSPTQSSERSSRFAQAIGFSSSPRQSLDLGLNPQRSHSDAGSSAPPAPSSTADLAQRKDIAALQRWSASLGAQVFAAAHALKSSSARGLSDSSFVEECFSRAVDARPPGADGTYGVKVYEATCEGGKKGALVAEDDEPRAGDIAVISAKFKHALSSKTVGSDSAPHLAVVVGWDAKKGKLRVVEVEKNGQLDEGAYKVEDMRAGQLTVFRVAPREA
ncbi:hypothetical protein JCM8097_009090 [Rhodosporidiobolus ruineniae]